MHRKKPPIDATIPDADKTVTRGVVCAVSAYLLWGGFPVFFKMVAHVFPLEVLAHRIFWSAFFLMILVMVTGQWRSTLKIYKQKQLVGMLFLSTLLISTNWGIFIYAVAAGHVLESSLGYYINPLLSIFLGFVFLGERLSRGQKFSLVLAASGVTFLALRYGQIPWISLCLAISFGFYGLVRKKARIDALQGLMVETTLIIPLAFSYMVYLYFSGSGAFLNISAGTDFLLIFSGILTALPLLLFNAATLKLRLMTIGFLQYITPSLHFILAVWVYDELFSQTHLICFVLIWAGLLIYSIDGFRQTQKHRRLKSWA